MFGPQTVNSQGEAHIAFEAVQQVAEVRHQAVVYNLTAAADKTTEQRWRN